MNWCEYLCFRGIEWLVRHAFISLHSMMRTHVYISVEHKLSPRNYIMSVKHECMLSLYDYGIGLMERERSISLKT